MSLNPPDDIIIQDEGLVQDQQSPNFDIDKISLHHQKESHSNTENISSQIVCQSSKINQPNIILPSMDKLENSIKLKKQYYKFFENIISDPQNYIPQLPSEEEFSKHKIKFLKGNKFNLELQSYHQTYIRIKNTERQGTIVIYTVIIAMFELEITLLNIDENAKEQQNKIGKGTFGSVRVQSQNYRIFAVKRQMFKNKYHMKEFNMMANKYEINEVIKQLSIYKICSLLKIGPAAETEIGFDLICYRDCIEFHIQYCMKIEYMSKNDNRRGIYVDKSKFEKQIKQCLLALHFYGIIHKDIKPANILFSVKYNKYLFTDFGISHPIVQKIGQLSQTYCQGTELYMLKQMRKIKKGNTGYVHLYGNDIHALYVTLRKQTMNQNIEKGLKQFEQERQQKSQKNVKYEYEYLKLKYYCFKPDIKMEEVQNYWKYMNTSRRQQLIEIVDKSIEYHKIKSVYNYLSRSSKECDLESLRIQSQSIKNIKIYPDIKQITKLKLKNALRVYGYSQQIKNMIIQIKLQQKYKDTLQMINKILNQQRQLNIRDRMLGNHVNYIKKVKNQILECQQNKDYRGMFKKFMIILKYGNLEEQLQTIQGLKMVNYQRNKEEKIEQMIRVCSIEKGKQRLKEFEQFMEGINQERDKVIREQDLDYQIAIIYQRMGKYEKALQYCTKSVNIYIAFYGEQHPYVADTYNNIAAIYDKMGQFEKALQYYTKCINMKISFYGEQHPSVAVTYNNRANIYQNMGKYDKALQYYTKSFNIKKSFYGQQHPSVADTYNNIAIVYKNMGKYDKALQYYTKCINMKISFYGEQHPSVAVTYNNMAAIYDSMGKCEQSLQYCTKSVNIYIAFYGEQHPSISETYNNIATVYDSMGKYEKALQYYTKCINMKISFYGEQHPSVAVTYNNIANVYGGMGKYEQALQYCTKSINMHRSFNGDQHPSIADAYNNFSFILFSLNYLNKSLKYCNKSMRIRSKLSLMQNLQLHKCYHLLSGIFFHKKKYNFSFHYEYSALDTFLKFSDFDNRKSPPYLTLLADIYYKMKRFIQSYFFYCMSYQISVKYFPIHHTNLRQIKHMMNQIECSMPFLIHNYATNIQFMNEISNKYSQVPKYKLMKVLLAKKWQLKFEQQHRIRRGNFQYLKCVIEIYICYKYLGYPRQLKKTGDQLKQQLLIFEQSQQKSIFRKFIYDLSGI